MSEMPSTEAPSLGLVARIIGVIFSPTETFKDVARHPRPVGVLAVVCLAIGLAAGLPQFTQVGRQAAIDMQVEQIERFSGQPVTPEMYAQMEARAGAGAYTSMIGVFIGVPVVVLIFSAVYWAIFNVVLGGTASLKEVLGVTAHAQVIGALGAVVGVPIQLMQGVLTQSGPFNLGALVPMLEPDSLLAVFLGAISVFSLWQAVVNGLGLAVLYKRKPALFIITLLAITLGFTALFSVGFSLIMGR